MKHFLIFIITFLSSIPLLSQPFIRSTVYDFCFEELQGRIIGVTQDNNGYIWVGTHNGLHKYNGNNFIKYKINQDEFSPLTSNRIDKVVPNNSGDIWCISKENIYLFNSRKEYFINFQEKLDDIKKEPIFINQIFSLPKGITWLGDSKGNLFRINELNPENDIEYIKFSNNDYSRLFSVWIDSNNNEWIFSEQGSYIYKDKKKEQISQSAFRYYKNIKNKLWLATIDGKIAYYLNDSKSLCFMKDMPQNLMLKDFRHYNDSVILISTVQGIFLLDCEKEKIKKISHIPLNNVYIDRQKRIWGSQDNKIFCIDKHAIATEYFSPYMDSPEDKVLFIEDEESNLWLIYRSGINKILFIDEKHKTLNSPLGLSQKEGSMKSLIVDNQQNVWFRLGYDLYKISLFGNRFVHSYNATESRTRELFIDKLGRIWICDINGYIRIFDSNRNLLGYLSNSGTITDQKSCFGSTIYSSFTEDNGNIWLGTNKGDVYRLYLQDDKNYRINHYEFLDEKNQKKYDPIFSILRDSKQRLWIGTLGSGLYTLEEDKFVHLDASLIRNRNMVFPKRVRYMTETDKGVLLIGSSEGLYCLNTDFNNFDELTIFYNKRDPHRQLSLNNNDIMHIAVTSSGIYVSTSSGGVNKIITENLLNNDLEFKVYSKKNLLASDVAFSVVEDHDKILWVIGESEITQMDVLNHSSNIYSGLNFHDGIRFTEAGAVIDSLGIAVGTSKGVMFFDPCKIQKKSFVPPIVFTDLFIQNKKSKLSLDDNLIHLRSDERDISFGFAVLDYNKTTNIIYSYKLDNEDWRKTTDNRVNYMNLPAGKHVFRIFSTNGDGVVVDNERQLSIIVDPKFSETFWFGIVLFIIACLLFSIILISYRRFYKLKNSLELEKRITEIKSHFFTEISHELRTPLTLIDGPVSELMRMGRNSDREVYHLSLIKNNTQRMLTLVNQILDFQKIQNNRMSLMIEEINLKIVMPAIISSFEHLSRKNQIQMNLFFDNSQLSDSNVDNIMLWADRDKLEKIMYNLLSNAFKYTPKEKSIDIVVKSNLGIIEISVKDEGIGISNEFINKIFDKFETVAEDNLFKPSSGLGLAIVKRFAELHDATLDVKSIVGVGSEFKLIFKSGREHFFSKDGVSFITTSYPNKKNIQREIVDTDDDTGDITVLIVEDNTEIRNYICSILSPYYHVIEAYNGANGLEMCRQHWPDMVISDLLMPVMDGKEMIYQIRNDKDLYIMPVLLLTSKSDIECKIEMLDLVIDDYITKPFNATYLKSKVKSVLQQRKQLKSYLLQSLMQNNSTSITDEKLTQDISTEDRCFIENVRNYVEENISDSELSIEQIAMACNYSRTLFYKKIKALMGIKPIDLVQEIRIIKAKELLKTNKYTISEVAYAIGYSDPRHFSRSFKKHIGILPSEYIKQQST